MRCASWEERLKGYDTRFVFAHGRYAIAMDYHKYRGVEGICVTCAKFVNWLEQLADMVTVYTTLHIDGFHKMHYGPKNWIVLALGTHCLHWDTAHGKGQYRQSFRPLVLMLCKQYESTESVKYMMDVLFCDFESHCVRFSCRSKAEWVCALCSRH